MEKIIIDNVGKRFGPHRVLKGISFEARPGNSFCLWGPNGCGKSTLLKIIAGLLRPSEGNVTYFGGGATGNIAGGVTGGPALFRNKTGMAAPDVKLYEELTAEENLEFISSSRGLPRNRDYEKELLGRLFPGGLRNEPLGDFSSGMRHKVCLVAALAHRPEALLLDEATSYFDTAGKAEAEIIISALKKNTILFVATNDPSERSWCEETIDLRGENNSGS